MKKINEEIEKVQKEIEEFKIDYNNSKNFKNTNTQKILARKYHCKKATLQALQKAKEIMQKDREDLKEKLKKKFPNKFICDMDTGKADFIYDIIDKIFSEGELNEKSKR